ncbi:hypothetical protein C8J57DRAFT_1522548 [Mycena rebaudengoi]|nr:hypothetical protein C8J57DRAFT_1522548 [Mycena rebaudengoi]
MSSNTTAQKRIGRDPLPKSTPTIDPKKLIAWGISGDQTDPLYLLQQLKKHVAFRKEGGTLVSKIAPLEEAFTAITDKLYLTLTEQAAEMTRLADAERSEKSQANPGIEGIQKYLSEQIDASTAYIANLFQTQERLPSQTQSSHHPASYAGAVKKPGSLGNHDNVTNHAPVSDAAQKFQITVKIGRVNSDHTIHKADSAKIVEMFNKAVSETVRANDSNLLTPITARSARRLRSGDITLQLRSSQDAELIRENTKEWLPRLAPDAWTYIPKFNVVINGMPATFDPTSDTAIRTLEDDNPEILLPFSIERARWLRTPKSNAGSIIIELKDTRSANQAIDSGLSSNYSLFTVHKLTSKLTQCFKCQDYGHIAKLCKETTVKCTLCAGDHDMKSCKFGHQHSDTCESNCSLPAEHREHRCANCGSNHPSYDRLCGRRVAERILVDSLPENLDPHFTPYLGNTLWSSQPVLLDAPTAART